MSDPAIEIVWRETDDGDFIADAGVLEMMVVPVNGGTVWAWTVDWPGDSCSGNSVSAEAARRDATLQAIGILTAVRAALVRWTRAHRREARA